MPQKSLIGVLEIAFTMFLFLTGTLLTIKNALELENDSWIVLLAVGLGGIILFLLYHTLWTINGDKSLYEILQLNLGRIIGKAIAIFYSLYFILICSKALTDFTNYVNSNLLYKTHPFFIKTSIFLIIIYTYLKGVEAFLRSSLIYGACIFLIILCIPLFVLISGDFHFEYTQPLFIGDLEKIWEVVPYLLTYPLGELVAFMILLPLLNKEGKKKIRKGAIIAIILYTLFTSFTAFLAIGVLHPKLASGFFYPFIMLIQEVSNFDFIERADLLVVFFILSTAYFKLSFLAYASARLIKDAFPANSKNIGIILIFTTLYFLPSYKDADFLNELIEGKSAIYFFHYSFQIYIPFFLLLLTLWKRRKREIFK
ncbi:spore germination protein [Sutcliffiella horikoshii]|uniref:GerAB/ArcD/ProY family transporter n=1 Tax=Sutcliffiella horikoshii TaxID=79883 RepID=UPI00384CF3D6